MLAKAAKLEELVTLLVAKMMYAAMLYGMVRLIIQMYIVFAHAAIR